MLKTIIFIQTFITINLFCFNKSKASNNNYDVIIVGGGTTAYSAAHTANKLSKKVLLINANLPIGGTSINIGAIPTKHLIRVANSIRTASHSSFKGVKNCLPKLNPKIILDEMRKLVKFKREKIFLGSLLKMKNVTLLKGFASFKNRNTILVNKREYHGKFFLIATGSITKVPYIKGLKSCEYLTLTSACNFKTLPKSITIMGGGNLGLELAMAYSQFGIKVRIIERSDQIFKRQTPDIAKEIEKSLKIANIKVFKNYDIKIIKKKGTDLIIHGTHNGVENQLIEKGKIILATGINGNTQKLNLQNARVKIGYKDMIAVNNRMQTNIPNIYSAGDCATTPCFAAVADMEARIAILNMFGANIEVDYSYAAWVAFTYPQVAGAGINEYIAKKNRIPYEVSKVPITKISKAQISNEKIGFIKLIRNPITDTLIGGQVIGTEAGELASLISFLIKYKIKTAEIAKGSFPYLTLSECIKNAAIAFKGKENKLCSPIP
ncbi:MAG: NAD(P)/FAD-dependent oxidoreductase [Bacteroidetes bacterium]|nr:NAD(P)/FAD-dependent oxidoreductase [Bacteroidota bacterium]